MLELTNIKDMVKDFANQYHFLQDAEIMNIEVAEFDENNYRQIDNKKYVSIITYMQKVEIVFGKIQILVDTIDEEDWYYIEKNIITSINPYLYTSTPELLSCMLEECKKNDLLI